MEVNNKKNHLSRIKVSFIMLLFAMCLTMNILLCSNYNLELSDKTTVIETWKIPENIVINGDGDNTTCFKSSFLNENNSYTEAITKNICPLLIMEAISKSSRLLFFYYSFPFYFLTLLILLPGEWTLINQKVRLNN